MLRGGSDDAVVHEFLYEGVILGQLPNPSRIEDVCPRVTDIRQSEARVLSTCDASNRDDRRTHALSVWVGVRLPDDPAVGFSDGFTELVK